MRTVSINQLLNEMMPYIEGVDNKELSIWCGAGVSINSGIPDAYTICRHILNALNCCEDDINKYFHTNSEYSLPVAFELFIETIVKNIVFVDDNITFLDIFAKNLKAQPNNNHHLWSHLLNDKKIRLIATTNFDTCFEEALNIEPLSERVVTPYPLKNFDNGQFRGKLIKLHNCISKPNNIGTTIEQITRRENVEDINKLVSQIFYKSQKESALLIMGYSCSDLMDIVPHIEYLGRIADDKGLKLPKVFFWQYEILEDDDVFIWEDIGNSQKIEPKTFETFRLFKEGIHIRGNIDVFVEKLMIRNDIIPIVNKSRTESKFEVKSGIKNSSFVLGELFREANKPDIAISYLQMGVLNANLKEQANYYSKLGLAYDDKGEYVKAISFYKKALKIYMRYPKMNIEIAETNNDLGISYSCNREYNNAIFRHKQALKIRLSLFGETHIDVAISYNNLGGTYFRAKDFDNAIVYFEKALDIYRLILGGKHRYIGIVLSNLGATHSNIKECDKAIEYYNESLQLKLSILSKNHPDIAYTYNNLGRVYCRKEEYEKAVIPYRKAIEIREIIYGDEYPNNAESYNNLGLTYKAIGNKIEAKECFEKCYNIGIKIRGKDDENVKRYEKNLKTI